MDHHLPTPNEAEFEELLANASERGLVKRREEEAARNSEKCADLKAQE
jgi:hypothetical protein